MTLDASVVVSRDGFRLEAILEAARGETVAIVGPNGAGKSTLVGALAGLLPPHNGRVVLDGTVLDDGVTHVPPNERSVGVLFQDRLLFPHLSAMDNVAFPLRARGIRTGHARARAHRLLERMGVDEFAQARPAHLSGGQAQRIALARALIHDPRLLLLDEPLGALDVRAKTSIRSLLRSMLSTFDGVALVVTHDPVDAMTLAARIVILEEGRITQNGTLDEIRTAPRSSFAAELVGVNVFTGSLQPLEHGAGSLVTAEGRIVVGWPDLPPSSIENVTAILRPGDVSLFRTRPEGSARNVLDGKITAIDREGERARVRLATSPPLVAEITTGSMERLELREGEKVWASFKALEVRLVLPE